tara:strand:+ start:26486 stop:28714 length:2229 start_codon:yes stop_codon:yes gene_type:complete
MKENNLKITYTITDEAPMLATYSLFPILKSYIAKADILLEKKNISLSSRVLSAFPDYLKDSQRVNDDLSDLGHMVKDKDANIIKLPNISASMPQLLATIEELQNKGFHIPNYPENPKTDEEIDIQKRYNKVKGSAVNPVLREGNSDRRAPISIKNYVKTNPHKMGLWNINSKTHVTSMKSGDFHHNEKSFCTSKSTQVSIELFLKSGDVIVLKDNISLLEEEIIDASFMSKNKLKKFIELEIQNCKDLNLLLSLHMKATMMKVSDPIIFGYVIEIYFADLFKKYHNVFSGIGVDVRNGFGDILDKINNLPNNQKSEILSDIERILENNASLAMVDSDKGITNLHVPSDVIIDASMPAMIRNSGKMWNKEGEAQDTKAIIPDSSYSSIYIATIDFCKEHGAFDPTTMGTVPNVGLMAQKAEEYGSHDKTFEISESGTIKVLDDTRNVLLEHEVEEGDIWRMCQTKYDPIKDWVKLAVSRAQITGWPAVFWLNENRAHDAQLIKKVYKFLNEHNTEGLDIKILDPYNATIFTLERLKKGQNTISVTGNVLRDYLTDLFPILELGTSAKMLSIVPLMNGGGLFETGAGGSAPKHVQQFIKEGHLRWDSLGEFMAISASLEHLAQNNNNKKASILSFTLDLAIEKLLKERKSPQRKVGEIDNRDSHYYLSMYWAEELAKQKDDIILSNIFSNLFGKMQEKEIDIVKELNANQGNCIHIKGYYLPNHDILSEAMRPSVILNELIDNF